MRLSTSNSQEITSPTAAQVSRVLESLPGGGESFAILESSPHAYVQVASSAQEGFLLEYREGSEDKHFEAAVNPVDLVVATNIFQKYVVGDVSWQSLVIWQPWGTGSPDNASTPLWALITVGVLVGCISQ